MSTERKRNRAEHVCSSRKVAVDYEPPPSVNDDDIWTSVTANVPHRGLAFSLKRCDGHQSYRCFEKYVISHSDVFYDGKKLDDASASSFKDLGYGYGKDSFDVYFCGKKISGASANSFRLLKDGYAKDSFDVYFYGEKVSDASASSFSVDENGYAHDTFSTYYFGKKIGD